MPPADAPPAAPAAPAPAAPAAPAAPPKGGAAPPAASPNALRESDWLADVGNDLDALDAAETARAEGRPPPKPAAAKPDDKPPGEKPAAPAKPDDKPAAPGAPTEPPAEPKGIAGVRSAYEGIKKKVSEEYLPKIQQLETKLKELETANPPEVKVLQERLEAAEKRRAELEQEIAFVDYSKSEEYKKNFEQPYIEAWEAARADLAEMQVEDAAGNARQATDDDLVMLAQLPFGEAVKKANAMFGDGANYIMAHRAKILDLAKKQTKALNEARTKATERATLKATSQKTLTETRSKLFAESTKAIADKWPAVFSPVAEDAEGNALLEKGTAVVDRIYNPTDATKPKSDEETVRLHAMIYQKARNHDRLKLWLNKANAKVKELEKALADYENSNPSGGTGGKPGGGKGGNGAEDPNAELDALDRLNK